MKTVVLIIMLAFIEGDRYEQLKIWSSSVIDWVVGSMLGRTQDEHLVLNAV